MDRERASLRFHDCTHLMYAHTVRAARTVVWHAMSVGTHLLLLLLLLLYRSRKSKGIVLIQNGSCP